VTQQTCGDAHPPEHGHARSNSGVVPEMLPELQHMCSCSHWHCVLLALGDHGSGVGGDGEDKEGEDGGEAHGC
jgi:hypothetical protein